MSEAKEQLIQCVMSYIKGGFHELAPRDALTSQAELQVMEWMLRDEEHRVKDLDPTRATFYQAQDESELAQRQALPLKDLRFYQESPWSVRLLKALEPSARSTELPISLACRLDRSLQINDFKGSRVMYLYHDIIDHYLFFSALEERGDFEPFQALWDQLGHPCQAHLFSRASEQVSGVSFALRHFAFNPLRPVPEGSRRAIFSYLSSERGSLKAQQRELLQELQARAEEPSCAALMTAVVFDVLAQLTDERRAWGQAKRMSSSLTQPHGARLIRPDYLLFVMSCVLNYIDGAYPIRLWCQRIASWVEALIQELKDAPLGFVKQFKVSELMDDAHESSSQVSMSEYLSLMTRYE